MRMLVYIIRNVVFRFAITVQWYPLKRTDCHDHVCV